MKKEKKITAWDYLWLAMYAFLGLGMDVVLMMVESSIYSSSIAGWTELNGWQHYLHWIIISIIWAVFTLILVRASKRKYGFDVMGFRDKPEVSKVIIAIILVVLGIVVQSIIAGRIKLIHEFTSKTLVAFLFQYVYYFLEVGLFILIIIFGQKFGEMLFGNKKLPWGEFLLKHIQNYGYR